MEGTVTISIKDYEKLIECEKITKHKTKVTTYRFGSSISHYWESFEMLDPNETEKELLRVNDLLKEEINRLQNIVDEKKPWYKFW